MIGAQHVALIQVHGARLGEYRAHTRTRACTSTWAPTSTCACTRACTCMCTCTRSRSRSCTCTCRLSKCAIHTLHSVHTVQTADLAHALFKLSSIQGRVLTITASRHVRLVNWFRSLTMFSAIASVPHRHAARCGDAHSCATKWFCGVDLLCCCTVYADWVHPVELRSISAALCI